MKAREPAGRTHLSGQGTGRDRKPSKAVPASPALPLDTTRLVQLNRLVGNATVSSLVGPVVQRMKLTEADESQIKALVKTEKKVAEKRIKKFDGTQAADWNFAIKFTSSSRIPPLDRSQFLAELYRSLGQGVALVDLVERRTALDRKFGEGWEERTPEKPAPKFPPTKGGPAPAFSLNEIKSAREGLTSTGGPTTKNRVPPPRPPRTNLPEQKHYVPYQEEAPKPLPEKHPSSWSGFPVDVRAELMVMWDAWQKGDTNADDFYDKFYKKSNLKPLEGSPTSEEYVKDLKDKKLLGKTSEAHAKKATGGYPLELENKGGTPKSRIYLNPHPRHIVEVYGFVRDEIHPMKGVIWTKLADHETAMTVRDAIVVYLEAGGEHARTETAVVDLLRGYQNSHPGHFIDEVPRLTTKRLPGVGAGAEPPDLERVTDDYMTNHMNMDGRDAHDRYDIVFSFSTYRSALIVKSIQDAAGKVASFQSLVADYFTQAGITLSNPATQEPPHPDIVRLVGMIREKK